MPLRLVWLAARVVFAANLGHAQEPCSERIQGKVPEGTAAGTWEVVVGKAKIAETPAEYDVCVILRTEPTLKPQPRLPYQDPGVLDDEARWYAGDFHMHTVQSDGTPTRSAGAMITKAPREAACSTAQWEHPQPWSSPRV